jgi:VIT1/CCC1 family predicted Fe2+/Mn2+ transporter
MLRYLVVLIALLAVAAVLTRAPRVRRALWTVLTLVAVYGVLKATGVVDALAPARDGVF